MRHFLSRKAQITLVSGLIPKPSASWVGITCHALWACVDEHLEAARSPLTWPWAACRCHIIRSPGLRGEEGPGSRESALTATERKRRMSNNTCRFALPLVCVWKTKTKLKLRRLDTGVPVAASFISRPTGQLCSPPWCLLFRLKWVNTENAAEASCGNAGVQRALPVFGWYSH